MIHYVLAGGFIALIFLYEWILKDERKAHRKELQEYMNHAEAERKELYDRIMSRNISEYKGNTEERPKNNKARNFLKQQIDSAYRQGGE